MDEEARRLRRRFLIALNIMISSLSHVHNLNHMSFTDVTFEYISTENILSSGQACKHRQLIVNCLVNDGTACL